jgi:hypothetical protein
MKVDILVPNLLQPRPPAGLILLVQGNLRAQDPWPQSQEAPPADG